MYECDLNDWVEWQGRKNTTVWSRNRISDIPFEWYRTMKVERDRPVDVCIFNDAHATVCILCNRSYRSNARDSTQKYTVIKPSGILIGQMWIVYFRALFFKIQSLKFSSMIPIHILSKLQGLFQVTFSIIPLLRFIDVNQSNLFNCFQFSYQQVKNKCTPN